MTYLSHSAPLDYWKKKMGTTGRMGGPHPQRNRSLGSVLKGTVTTFLSLI